MRNEKARVLDYDMLYNKEWKKAFIEQYDVEETRVTIYCQLVKISKSENFGEFKLNKDISQMNHEELESLLKEIECSAITSAINHLSTYNRYCSFVCGELTDYNPFYKYKQYGISKLAEDVVANKYNMRYTREEILYMIDELINPTDQALILALFEGIKGKYFSELLTLTIDNVKQKTDEQDNDIYYARVYDEDSKTYRNVNISKKLYILFHRANQEKYYYSNEIDNVKTLFQDSPYIFKRSLKGKARDNENSPLDRHFITRKFLFFKKHFGNSFLSADDIFQSGMQHMAHELYLETGKLGREELIKIGEKFNTVMACTKKSEPYRNITMLKRIIFTESLGLLYKELKGVKYNT